MRKFRWSIIGIVLVLLGVILRLYHRDQAMYFMNDQGLVMLVSHEIRTALHMPLAGPRISIDANIPPLTYYLVTLFSYFRSDPLVVSTVYIVLNIIACMMLSLYSSLIFDVATGLWTLGISMVSMNMIESSRSIWEPHSTFWFVAFYLYSTEIGYRKKNIWIYLIGIVAYCIGIALYPTPALLMPYVIVRMGMQMRSFDIRIVRYPYRYALGSVVGILLSVLLPWGVYSGSLGSLFIPHAISSLSVVSFARMTHVLYTYISNMFHDVFRIWIVLPSWLVGSVWMKILALLGLICISVTLGKQRLIGMFRYMIRNKYIWIVIGFILPSFVGMRMAPHRLLPFVPFVYVLFAYWLRQSFRRSSIFSRIVAVCILGIFIVGNVVSWYTTTISDPRNEYPRAQHAARLVMNDMSSRNISAYDIGIHYFRPDDQADYFGSFIWYLLHVSVRYPISFLPLGNSIVRNDEEKHTVVYLLCDGFTAESEIPGCIKPFTSKWPAYSPVQSYRVSSAETLIVFIHSPT